MLGFITGAACVYLTLRENIWTFPVGLANNLVFLALFLHGRLFGDAGLQLVYVVLGIQGWQHWLRGGENKSALRVRRSSARMLTLTAAALFVATGGLVEVFRLMKDAAPFLDALTTALSLAAQFLLNRKAIENWWLWLFADLVYVYLYSCRGLLLTAILYGVFGCLCVSGLITWRRTLARVEDTTRV